MYYELRENKVHGTKEFPYMDYHVLGLKNPFQIPVHWHDEIEVIYVKSGPFTVVIEGEEYDSKAGDVFIVNPGELHLMGSKVLGADYHTFVFPLELISFKTDDELEETFFNPLVNGNMKFKNAIPNNLVTKEMKQNFEELIKEYNSDTRTRQLKIRILLLQFFEMLARDETIRKIENDKSTLGKDIITYLQQNYTQEIRLSDLAEEFHLSEKYLSRYFKQSFRITISQYIGHLRITRAKHLLETVDYPITTVCELSGFQDVSYFVRSFHKVVGLSPLQYRKNKNLSLEEF